MKKTFLLFSIVLFLCDYSKAQSVSIPYFNSNGNQTPEYSDVISFYKNISKINSSISVELKAYESDVLEPIYLVSITKGETVGKVTILINNGIHPGEPEGIDASMILTKNIIDVISKNKLESQKYFSNKYDEQKILNNILDYANIYIIPIYNVDGSLRRNSTSRANQNGPEEYGFRGNAKNLDLNRDFIKLDSKNAKSFVEIFHKTKPHVFIDMHTSNGADYQHIVTYIATQKDKLQKDVSNYQYEKFIPELDKHLKKYKFDPVPYVNAWVDVPDSGWSAFYESPRYATGYTTLYNTIGFTVETHMLKNYKQRVEGSYAFLLSSLEIIKKDNAIIIETKDKADEALLSQNEFQINWKLDSTKLKFIEFKGYHAAYKKSEISGTNRLYYDRTKPFNKLVKYYENYKPANSVKKPVAYIIPRAWDEVIQRLKLNGVQMQVVSADTVLDLSVYYIDDYKTVSKPYEGHYLHSNVKTHIEQQKLKISKGDYIIYTNQASCRFIIETLEPQSIDSYFNWNFFDAILGQKEHFSDYVFEDTAAELLRKDIDLKNKLEKRKLEDPTFTKNSYSQLEFIYKNSSYFEKSYLRYPVYRLEK